LAAAPAIDGPRGTVVSTIPEGALRGCAKQVRGILNWVKEAAVNRYSEAFWPLVAGPLLVVIAAVRTVRDPTALAVIVLVGLLVAAMALDLVVWRELRRKWRGEEIGRIGRQIGALEHDRSRMIVWTALYITAVGMVVTFPLAGGLVVSLLAAAASFVGWRWALAERVSRFDSRPGG